MTTSIDPRLDPTRVVRAPRGSQLTCKNWVTEAAYRMVQNNLDPEVAENPQSLVVYGGIGRAARDWACFDQILASLKDLNEDESLLIQSGKPVGVFKTHANAPRVLIANSNLVPKWANWEHFNELDRKGLFMYGADDGGLVDLHRHPRHRARHVRDLCGSRSPALQQRLDRPLDFDSRSGRYGRCAALGCHVGWGLLAQHRMPAKQHRLPSAHPLCGQAGQRPGRGPGPDRAPHRRQRGDINCLAGQRGRGLTRIGAPRPSGWHAPRSGDRPDLGA